jgi:hypothetical protein
MWSKGAQKDYLDIYDDEEEEYDDYEEPSRVEEKPKVEVKVIPVEVKAVEIKPVEVKQEVLFDSESDFNSDYDEYSKKEKLHKFNFFEDVNINEMYIDEVLFDDIQSMSTSNPELYKAYKDYNSVSSVIKRFGFKKLKSNDKNIYYLDKVLYFIWKHIKNPKTNEEFLVKAEDKMYDILRKLNTETLIYDRYLGQPEIYF